MNYHICFFEYYVGAMIKKIELFNKNWGQVQLETKNYIWSIWENYDKSGFFLFLFFHQIWVFLTSIWPLILGVVVNYLIIVKLFWLEIDYNNLNQDLSVIYSNFYNIIIFVVYILLLPSFILSFQDISNFIISKQEDWLATFWCSIINSIIFLSFILFFTLFYEIFLYFLYFYLIIFFLLLLFSLLVKIILVFRK